MKQMDAGLLVISSLDSGMQLLFTFTYELEEQFSSSESYKLPNVDPFTKMNDFNMRIYLHGDILGCRYANNIICIGSSVYEFERGSFPEVC